MERVDNIEALGQPTTDLKSLATKPFTTGTDFSFKSCATQICTAVVSGTHTETIHRMVNNMSQFHMTLLQQEDCSPERAGKRDQDQVLTMLSTLNIKVKILQKGNPGNTNNNTRNSSNRGGKKCCKCGSPDHLIEDCPLMKNPGSQGGKTNQGQSRKELEAWRKQVQNGRRSLDSWRQGSFHKGTQVTKGLVG